MVQYGFGGAALATWAVVMLQFLALARRYFVQSQEYPVELSDHGKRFFVSQAEAGGLLGLTGLAVAFFGVAFLMQLWIRRRAA